MESVFTMKRFELAFVFHDKADAILCYRGMVDNNLHNIFEIHKTEYCVFVRKVPFQVAHTLIGNFGMKFEKTLKRVGING